MDFLAIERWIENVISETGTVKSSRKRSLEDQELPSQLSPKRQCRESDPQPPKQEKRRRLSSVSSGTLKRFPLDKLDKPVHFFDSGNSSDNLPADVKSLWDALHASAKLHIGIIPFSMKEQILSVMPDMPEAYFQSLSHDTNPLKWDTVVRLMETAKVCVEHSYDKVFWNFHIHLDILHEAIQGQAGVRLETLATNAIYRIYQPESYPKDYRLIDFGISLRPDENLRARLENVLDGNSSVDSTINPILSTQSPWLHTCPIAIPIETKPATPRGGTGEYQLGFWISAWHKRLDRLVGPTRAPTLPAITVVGHDWRLYMAEDKGDRIVFHGPMKIGSTARADELCALVACLRQLVAWTATNFKDWLSNLITLCEQHMDGADVPTVCGAW